MLCPPLAALSQAGGCDEVQPVSLQGDRYGADQVYGHGKGHDPSRDEEAERLELAAIAAEMKDEFVDQYDPNLIIGRTEDLQLIRGSVAAVHPDQLRQNKKARHSFTFGRSESNIEKILRDSKGTHEEPHTGTHVLALRGTPQEARRQGGVHFKETIEMTVELEQASFFNGVQSSELVPSTEPLQLTTVNRLKKLFDRLDIDGSESISMKEAISFWSKGFSKISAAAMFAEVDADDDGSISLAEFVSFWQQVKNSGYTDAQIFEELEHMLDGGMWVDWKDGKCTGVG